MPKDFLSSATQVSVYELCNRKWGWIYLDGLRPEPNKFAVVGIDVHQHIEAWEKSRRVPIPTTSTDVAAKLAQAMLPHLPTPHEVDPENVEIEIEVWFGHVGFTGNIDLWMPDRDPPKIYDHKTTKDFVWALTPERLLKDPQAAIYAAWGLLKTGKTAVELQWTYGKTQGAPKCLAVQAVATHQAIEPRLKRSIELANEMRLIKQAGCSAMELPIDAAGCEAYGGCPFQKKCNLTPQERLASIMSQGTAVNPLVAKLKAAKNGSSGAQGVNPPESKAASNPLVAKMAAKTQTTVETEGAEAQAEEAPKRRGRPPKNAAAPEPEADPVNPEAEVWQRFASAFASGLMVAGGDMVVTEEAEIHASVAKMAGSYADEMLVQYRSRFGG